MGIYNELEHGASKKLVDIIKNEPIGRYICTTCLGQEIIRKHED